jgi:hypothetical protein
MYQNETLDGSRMTLKDHWGSILVENISFAWHILEVVYLNDGIGTSRNPSVLSSLEIGAGGMHHPNKCMTGPSCPYFGGIGNSVAVFVVVVFGWQRHCEFLEKKLAEVFSRS